MAISNQHATQVLAEAYTFEQVPFLSYCWVAHTVLKYMKQDTAFGVFRNEHGKAEFAMQVVKDARGTTFTPVGGRRSLLNAFRVAWEG